jgi:hypothetical protein
VTQEATETKQVYISGPISLNGTLSSAQVELNRRRFKAVALWLRRRQHVPLDPTDQAVVEGWQWADYMRVALAQLLRAQAILLLPGWQESRGSRLEHQVAVALGMEIWHWEVEEK